MLTHSWEVAKAFAFQHSIQQVTALGAARGKHVDFQVVSCQNPGPHMATAVFKSISVSRLAVPLMQHVRPPT